ncbi:centriole, cilia and spindle-associated protein-like [Carlito syrichta]|uniref:Centriole, cilia and spindle-associated protein-like n=1 Tax=Carlito syrichta TaxID=1868482 RepID=A0A3Q0EL04_CARSF|nr:centriole, cilia and spindle-associated protein-like [Carlito syrichta]
MAASGAAITALVGSTGLRRRKSCLELTQSISHDSSFNGLPPAYAREKGLCGKCRCCVINRPENQWLSPGLGYLLQNTACPFNEVGCLGRSRLGTPGMGEDEKGSASRKSLGGCVPFLALPVRDAEENLEQQIGTKETDRLPAGVEPRQQPSALFARGSRRAGKSPQRPSSKIKENKHPFALYGWGEKQADTGSQKTHNVCASAPVHEIHESALRAKNRRQVEKRKLVAQRQRAHSVDVDRNRRLKAPSSENPWMTEYMRCYSARA